MKPMIASATARTAQVSLDIQSNVRHMHPEEEVHEHAEHARQPFDKKVAASMAGIAAALAVVAVFGQLSNTEEIIGQQKASEQWAYYQAKNIRRYVSEVAHDTLFAMKSEKAGEYTEKAKQYRKEADEIQEQAKEFEKESLSYGHKARRLHFGEIFLEIALVFASLAILTKRELIWVTAIVGALIGIGTAATSLLLH